MEINANNAIAILSAAHQFNIPEIVNATVRFLEKQLQPKNCLGIHQLALEHKLNDFAQTAWNYILDHFDDLIDENPEFLNLSFDQLKRFLASGTSSDSNFRRGDERYSRSHQRSIRRERVRSVVHVARPRSTTLP